MSIELVSNPETDHLIKKLQLSVKGKDSVQGYTHNYYKYPARFSPKFARAAIDLFSEPNDVVLDPFVGGGTTLVEALAHNRHAIGFDVSPIATFVSQAKTTILSEHDFEDIKNWALKAANKTIFSYTADIGFYLNDGYLNNLPWNLRQIIAIVLEDLHLLESIEQQRMAQCILLKTAQWAVDCRKNIPTVKEFRKKFIENIGVFKHGNGELAIAVNKYEAGRLSYSINDSSENALSHFEKLMLPAKPKLVVTSPPYVGVHMLYHQWQLQSRKRTRTPFWIINSLDGQGSAYYTFGHYQRHGRKTYFDIAEKVFKSLKPVLHSEATIVQLVGFSNAKRYLGKYLNMMNEAGFEEVSLVTDSLNRNRRIWRDVPNRKWYASSNNRITSGKEVVLVHKLKPE